MSRTREGSPASGARGGQDSCRAGAAASKKSTQRRPQLRKRTTHRGAVLMSHECPHEPTEHRVDACRHRASRRRVPTRSNHSRGEPRRSSIARTGAEDGVARPSRDDGASRRMARRIDRRGEGASGPMRRKRGELRASFGQPVRVRAESVGGISCRRDRTARRIGHRVASVTSCSMSTAGSCSQSGDFASAADKVIMRADA